LSVELHGVAVQAHRVQPGRHVPYEGDETDPDQECITQEWCFSLDVKARGNILMIGETTTCTDSGKYDARALRSPPGSRAPLSRQSAHRQRCDATVPNPRRTRWSYGRVEEGGP
jgi:hypothetical protein